MEKKRSVGVTIFGYLIIISGILAIAWNWKNFPVFADARLKNFLIICNTLLVSSLIYGLGILMLKDWARKLALIVNIVVLVAYPSLLYIWKISGPTFAIVVSIGFPIAILYFFTRPKVKEQFK